MSARIPDESHDLKGTRPTRATAQAESAFTSGRPKMPAHFTNDEAAVWKQIVKLLAGRKVLTKLDGPSIALYVETHMRHQALLQELKARGEMIDETIVISGGETITVRKANPASKLATALASQLRAMLREFGGTVLTREKSKQAKKAAPRSETFEPGTVGWILQQRGQKFIGGEPTPNVVDEEPDMGD